MTKTKAPQKTPSPVKGTQSTAEPVTSDKNYRAEFVSAVLGMSWQLAIVVLVPIIGGFELDNALDTLPALTIVGFILAMIGMALVVWRQVQLVTPPLPPQQKGKQS